MTEPGNTRAYLTSRLDQVAAAEAAGDGATADDVIAGIIRDDNPQAREVIADALRLLAAKEAATGDRRRGQ